MGAVNSFLDANQSGGSGSPCQHYIWVEGLRGITSSAEQAVMGIFALDSGRRIKEITDGTSSTIATGELHRLYNPQPAGPCARISNDGWAVGGSSTLFDTDASLVPDDGLPIGGVNSGFFQNPGSDHPGGAQFGMVDGSARFISEDIDEMLFQALGTIAGGEIIGEY